MRTATTAPLSCAEAWAPADDRRGLRAHSANRNQAVVSTPAASIIVERKVSAPGATVIAERPISPSTLNAEQATDMVKITFTGDRLDRRAA